MTKPSERLIHNVLFTTVSVLMFIFKFIVLIVVYIKKLFFLLLFLLLFYTKLVKSFNSTNFFVKYFVKKLRVVSESFPLSIVLQIYGDYSITPNILYYFFIYFVCSECATSSCPCDPKRCLNSTTNCENVIAVQIAPNIVIRTLNPAASAKK